MASSQCNMPWRSVLAAGGVAAVAVGWYYFACRDEESRRPPIEKAPVGIPAAASRRGGAATPKAAPAAAATATHESAQDWYERGLALSSGSFVRDPATGQPVDEAGCFLRAIAIDSTFAPAWNGLGCVTEHSSTCSIPGFGDMTPTQMFVRAIELQPQLAKAFLNLAKTPCSTPITLNGVMYGTRPDLAAKAAELDGTCGEAWFVLSRLLHIAQCHEHHDHDHSNGCCHDAQPQQVLVDGKQVASPSAAVRAAALGHPGAHLHLLMVMLANGMEVVAFVDGRDADISEVLAVAAAEALERRDSDGLERVAAACLDVGLTAVPVASRVSEMTPLLLLAASIEADGSNMSAWSRLGDLMEDDGEPVELLGRGITRSEVLLHIAMHAEDDRCASLCWLQLCEKALDLEEPLVFCTREDPLTARVCAAFAHSRSPNFAAIWVAVYRVLESEHSDTFTATDGSSVSALEALTRALECNDVEDNASTATEAWQLLGRRLLRDGLASVLVKGKSVSALAAFVECVRCAPDTDAPMAWYYLGAAMAHLGVASATINDDDEEVTRKDCWLRCVAGQQDFAPAWNNLGTDLDGDEEIDVNGNTITKWDCFTRALEISSDDANAWCNLGALLQEREAAADGSPPAFELMTNDGDCREYEAEECFTTSLACSNCSGATAADAWTRLGNILTSAPDRHQGQHVVVNGVEYSAVDCFAQALCSLPTPTASAWRAVGTAMESGGDGLVTLPTSGRVVTREDCFAAADAMLSDESEDEE